MSTVDCAIKLPVVRRARCATGLNARQQVGQPHTFRIPTWAQCSDRRMEHRIATRDVVAVCPTSFANGMGHHMTNRGTSM